MRIERSKDYTDAVTLDMEFKYFTQVFGTPRKKPISRTAPFLGDWSGPS